MKDAALEHEPAETVRVSQHGTSRVIRIDRPHVSNALDTETMAALATALLDAETDHKVRCVVLTGTGPKAFCAGLDLKAFAADRQRGPDGSAGIDVVTKRTYGKPLISAVNGAAVAGGFELMLASDLAVAAEHAIFALPQVKRGLVAAGGGTGIAAHLPLAVAMEITLTGEPISARRAFELGLVNRVVPAEDVLDTALALADVIGANGPLAVATTKRLVRESVHLTDWKRLDEIVEPVFASQDALEGSRAFLERRTPQWIGR